MTSQLPKTQQLRHLCRALKANILDEKRKLNDFQLQKERVAAFNELAKQERSDLALQWRSRMRQKQDMEEKHAYVLQLYKEKVKHLLMENQLVMEDVVYENYEMSQLLKKSQRDAQHELKKENRKLAVILRLMEVQHDAVKNNMRREQEQKIMALRQLFERKSREMKQLYDRKMKRSREAAETQRKQDIKVIETKKAEHIYRLTAAHKREFEEIKEYYHDITKSNLDLIRKLRKDLARMRTREQLMLRQKQVIVRANRKLSKPLEETRANVERLKQDLRTYETQKVGMRECQVQLEEQGELMKNLQWEHEVLLQKMEAVNEEYLMLRRRLSSTVFDVQQKVGFQRLILEKKVSTLSDDLEKTESALSEILSSVSVGPEHSEVASTVRFSLEDVMMAKNKEIQILQDEIVMLKQTYAQTMSYYDDLMAKNHILPEELGFEPARTL